MFKIALCVDHQGMDDGMSIHFVFDLLAALSAMAMTAFVYRWRIAGSAQDPQGPMSAGYLAALVAGAVIGGYGCGTANLWLSGIHEVGRSIIGALAGAIAAIEIYKQSFGIRRSTGLVFVAAFATSVAIGRIGCLLSGLDDETYGIPTDSNWGWDFGDGILRHPVQLYESLTMAGFLGVALLAFARREPFFMRDGFYLLVTFYAGQRFVWEFLKPYATVLGPFNIFHLLCLALVAYGIAMIAGERRHERAAA
jgi:phosphatidylglycerol---prolipoprotein diacylglyceryl transferase